MVLQTPERQEAYQAKLKAFKEAYKLQQLNTSKETAHALRISDSTLRKSRSTGYLLGIEAPDHIKYGKKVHYSADAIMAWVNALESCEARSM